MFAISKSISRDDLKEKIFEPSVINIEELPPLKPEKEFEYYQPLIALLASIYNDEK